jgi:hypothetical protein
MALEPLWKGSELFHKLLSDYLADKIDAPLFCSNFEHAWNFDVELRDLAPAEYEIFSGLFHEVAYFSPESPETWEYPGYRSAEQIREAAIKAVAELRKS